MTTCDKLGGQNTTKSCEFVGLSTDVKPIDTDVVDIPNGSSYLEMDTLNVSFFNKEINAWI